MAIFRGNSIRGSQIKDRTIEGDQILQNALSNEHISSDAAIHESKLDINWNAHTEILEDRKVVDFVQINGIPVSGTGVNLETLVPSLTGIPTADSNEAKEGIIVSGDKNLAPMRDAVTGEPLVAQIGNIDYEVLARVEHDGVNYKLNFYTTSGIDGAEELYDLGENHITVDIQYARRFNLRTVDEMFAANEKFVHGAADVTSHLNIEQLAKDIYGGSWSVDRDGEANLSKSLVEQVSSEVSRAQLAESVLQNNIDAEQVARIDGDRDLQGKIDVINGDSATLGSINYKIKNQVTDILASTATNQGASTVGIEAITGMTGVTNVQDALEYLKANAGDALSDFQSDIKSTQTGKGASIVGVDALSGLNGTTVQTVLVDHENRVDTLENLVNSANDRTETTNGYYSTQSFENLNARLEDSESIVDANLKRLDDALAQEVVDRNTAIATEKSRAEAAETQLQQNLDDEVLARTNADIELDNKIEQEILDRQAADTAIKTDLASTSIAKGASLIGVADAGNKFTATTVEGVLGEIEGRLYNVEQTGGAELVAARNSDITGEHATLDSRIEAAEDRYETVKGEVETARGSLESLNSRLSVSIRADGFLVDDAKIHEHKKYTFTVTESQTRVYLPAGEKFNLSVVTGSGTVTKDGVQVYINGILQANGINFVEIADNVDETKGIAVDFTPEELVPGDVVVIEWVVNNAN